MGETTFHNADIIQQNPTTLRLKRAKKHNGLHWNQKRIIKGNKIIEKIGNHLGIPLYHQEEVAYVYRKLLNGGYLRGRKIALMIPAIYLEVLSCYPAKWTYQDITKAGDVQDMRSFQTCWSKLHLELLKQPLFPGTMTFYQDPHAKIALAVSLMTRHGHEFRIPYPMLTYFARFVQRHEAMFNDIIAEGIAGGCLYYMTQKLGLSYTQTQIAAALDVNEITLRKAYKRIVAFAAKHADVNAKK